MRRGTATVLFGVSLGVVAIWAYTRLRDRNVEENPDALAERIAERLKELEETTSAD